MESRRPMITTAPGYSPSRMPACAARSTSAKLWAAAGANGSMVSRRARAAHRREAVIGGCTGSVSGELVAHRAGRQPVEHLDGAAIAVGERTRARRREHHVVGVGRVRKTERMTGLVHGDREERGVGKHGPGVGLERERDGSTPY